jgi:hypothetical protein
MGGISGWMLGDGWDTDNWSIWEVGKNIPLSSRDPSGIGVRWIQVTYFTFSMFMPVAFLLFMIFLYLKPLTLRSHKAIHVLVEIFYAWSGVDIFIVSILAAVLQISQLAESLVGDRCDFLLPFLHDYMHDALDGNDKCFVVLAEYKFGSVVLVIAAILLALLGLLTILISSSALSDRTHKYYRLIQYALYNRQVKEGTLNTRLIPFEDYRLGGDLQGDKFNLSGGGGAGGGAGGGGDDDNYNNKSNQSGDKLLGNNTTAITQCNHKSTAIVHLVNDIIKDQDTTIKPIETVPSWFGVILFFEKCGLIRLSRSGVVGDVFGWSRGRGGIDGGNNDSTNTDDGNNIGWDTFEVEKAISESTILDSPQSRQFERDIDGDDDNNNDDDDDGILIQKNKNKNGKKATGGKKGNKTKVGVQSDDGEGYEYSLLSTPSNSPQSTKLTTSDRQSYSQSHLGPSVE